MNMPELHSHQCWPICSNDHWHRERIADSCETLNFRSCNGWFLGEQHAEWPFKTWRNTFSHGRATIPRTPTFTHLFTTINDISKGLRTGSLGETISSGICSQIFHLWEGGILGSENVNETICCQFSCDAFCHFFARFPGFIPKKIQQALWLESRIQPPGVEAELAAMGSTRAFTIQHALAGMQSS
jgi:hypothetical protein